MFMGHSGSYGVSTVALPSLNDAIEALNDFCNDLLSALQNIVDISAELEHMEHWRIDSLKDVRPHCTVSASPSQLKLFHAGCNLHGCRFLKTFGCETVSDRCCALP